MDINFFDEPGAAPKPRNEMEVLRLQAKPYDDSRRVHVEVDITAFTPSDRPNLDIEAHNAAGQPVASLTIIETMQNKMSFTLHIREPEPSGEYILQAKLYYDDPEKVQHERQQTFSMP